MFVKICVLSTQSNYSPQSKVTLHILSRPQNSTVSVDKGTLADKLLWKNGEKIFGIWDGWFQDDCYMNRYVFTC